MLEGGLDREDDYAFSVFKNLTDLKPAKQLDFRALVGFAERVLKATTFERELIVLSHGNFSIDVGERFGPHPVHSYSPWADMLTRWASDFLDKVDSIAAPSVRRALGRSSRKRGTHS
jgi:hypothetical protein